MSRYAIPTISGADRDIANSPEIGAENRVFYSKEDVAYLGKLEQDEADAGTLTLDPAYAAPASKLSGYDLQAVLRQALLSPAGAFVASLNVTFAGKAITSSTLASPAVITSAGHGLETGDKVDISGVTGSGATGLNGLDRTVTKIDANTFTVAINASGAGTGGVFNKRGTATASFAAPGHVSDQGYDLPQALAVDVLPDAPDEDKTIRTIDSIDSVTNGASGNWIEFYKLPTAGSYIEVACCEDKNITFPSPEPVRIPCGYKAAAFTKLGRETDPQITLSSKHRGFAEGLLRLNGLRHTLKVEVRKDKRVLAERIVLLDVIGQYSVEKGDGNAVSMDRCTGIFSTAGIFT